MSLSLVNQALRRIYAAPIDALDGLTEKKRIIQDELDAAVSFVIRDHGWSELTKTICPDELSLDTCCDDGVCALPVGFCHAFAIPCDMMRIRRVDIKSKQDCTLSMFQWRMFKAGNTLSIATSHAPIIIEYVQLPSDLSRLSPDLREAIKLNLAMRLSAPLNADKSLYEMLTAEYTNVIRMARGSSEEEDQQDHFIGGRSEMVEARRNMWGYGFGSFYD